MRFVERNLCARLTIHKWVLWAGRTCPLSPNASVVIRPRFSTDEIAMSGDVKQIPTFVLIDGPGIAYAADGLLKGTPNLSTDQVFAGVKSK